MRAKAIAKAVLPARMRRALRRSYDELGELRALPQRLVRLETLMFESHEQVHGRSQERWIAAAPDADLTFGRDLRGDAFVAKAGSYGAFGPGKTVLEIGPGYGRLLDAALRREVGFARWIGVDLSSHNVEYLRKRFAGSPAEFINADAESVELQERADTLVSSLTLKHMYPSFEVALANVVGSMTEGATLVFDLIEGRRRYFQDDGRTFIRWYGRDEVVQILDRSGCELVAFDDVHHDADHCRLLVVARCRLAAAA